MFSTSRKFSDNLPTSQNLGGWQLSFFPTGVDIGKRAPILEVYSASSDRLTARQKSDKNALKHLIFIKKVL